MKAYRADLIDPATGQLHRIIYVASPEALASWHEAHLVPENTQPITVAPELMEALRQQIEFEVEVAGMVLQ